MSHPQQVNFCKKVRRLYPKHFVNANVVDAGSLDINGNNRYLFRRSLSPLNLKGINCYVGIDIVLGKNVHAVGPVHEVIAKLPEYLINVWPMKNKSNWPVDVVISTEMLEHDRHWRKSLSAMYNILKPGGLLLITAAGDGRMEHGTAMSHPIASPGTHDYYQNMSNEMFTSALPRPIFDDYFINQDPENNDFQFYGIKKPDYVFIL